MRGDFVIKVRRGFTLIELIIAMAIIGLLIALIIPNIDRSLSKNSVANDAELFKAKLEEVRLMSGSTQLFDESNGNSGSSSADQTSYYAIILHRLNAYDDQYISIVRLSNPYKNPNAGECNFVTSNPPSIFIQANNQSGPCFVQRVALSRGVRVTLRQQQEQTGGLDTFLIGFRAPSQQLVKFLRTSPGQPWQELAPDFHGRPLFELTYKDKKAIVSVDDYTGRVTVQYEQI